MFRAINRKRNVCDFINYTYLSPSVSAPPVGTVFGQPQAKKSAINAGATVSTVWLFSHLLMAFTFGREADDARLEATAAVRHAHPISRP